jgi:hypothetical protein
MMPLNNMPMNQQQQMEMAMRGGGGGGGGGGKINYPPNMNNNNFNRQSPNDFMRGPPLGPGNMPPNKMMRGMNGPLIHPSDDPFGGPQMPPYGIPDNNNFMGMGGGPMMNEPFNMPPQSGMDNRQQQPPGMNNNNFMNMSGPPPQLQPPPPQQQPPPSKHRSSKNRPNNNNNNNQPNMFDIEIMNQRGNMPPNQMYNPEMTNGPPRFNHPMGMNHQRLPINMDGKFLLILFIK